MSKALIIAPHPDDEINIAGCIIGPLKEKGFEVIVVICSNGDYYPQLTGIRYNETLKVKGILGYDRLIYLGYGDEYKGKHIYDLKSDEVSMSSSSHSNTYHPIGGKEFCYECEGIHRQYTRNNFKEDIKKLILSELADVLVCVDLDVHPDHRCVSLLFDEVMGEVLRKNLDYKPIILKKFAYLGVWHGEDDYFETIVQDTKPTILGINASPFPYVWDDRIRFSTPSFYYSLFFWRSPLFKALKSYRTQSVTTNPINCCISSMKRQINSDAVYWMRRSDSCLYDASIKVSTGDPSYLTDFKVYDTDSVRIHNLLESNKYWDAKIDNTGAFIICEFHSPVQISTITIYQHPNYAVKRLELSTDSGFNRLYEFNQASIVRIPFSCDEKIQSMKLNITEGYSNRVKIGEIEAFSEPDSFIVNRIPLDCMAMKTPHKVRNKYICDALNTFFDLYSRFFVKLNRTKWRKVFDA